jgi:hypothetical protein
MEFTGRIMKNSSEDELPLMITFSVEGTPACDVCYNKILEKFVVDSSITGHYSNFSMTWILKKFKKHFKDFFEMYNPVELTGDNKIHYKRKEYPYFGLKGVEKCDSCGGKGKRWYGEWEHTDDHTYLASCKACGGTGEKPKVS